MPRFAPLDPKDLPDFRAVIDAIREDHGYVPNSFLTQGRVPGLLAGTGLLADALWYPDQPEQRIRRLVAFGYSFFSGAMYSAAHTGEGAAAFGVPIGKLQAIADYRTDQRFDDDERAVLELCEAAAKAPAEVEDRHVKALETFFDNTTILRIVGLIAWHAFLNKWNDICGTTLEGTPRLFAEAHLAPAGWRLNSHG